MKVEEANKKIVANFIEEIWNNSRFELLSDFLHPEFKDHSLPFDFLRNKHGLLLYLKKLNKSINHRTIVRGITAERNMVYVKFHLKAQTYGADQACERYCTNVCGYRFFKIENERIKDHWEAIETFVDDYQS